MKKHFRLITLALIGAATLFVSCQNLNGGDTTPTTYTVTFDSNGGSSVASQTVDSNSKATKPTDPAKDTYSFAGWTKDGAAYDFNTPVTSNVTLTATWSALPVFTVTFDSNGGSVVSSQSVIQGKLASEPSSTYAPHNLLGWYDGSTKYDFTKAVTANVTLKAKWTTTKVVEDEVKSQNSDGPLTFTATLVMANGAFTNTYVTNVAGAPDTTTTDVGTYTLTGSVYTFKYTSNGKTCSYTEFNGSWALTPANSSVTLPGFGNSATATTSVTVTKSHNVEE